jgi:hypothetical protein
MRSLGAIRCRLPHPPVPSAFAAGCVQSRSQKAVAEIRIMPRRSTFLFAGAREQRGMSG